MGSLGVFKNYAVPSKFPYGIPDVDLKASGNADALPVGTYTVFVTTGSADLMTLPLPKAGVYPPPSAGNTLSNLLDQANDDGASITIVSTTLFAHTVTTPTNGINGNKHILTFSAVTAAAFVQLIAYNGSWWVLGQLGVTIS